MIVVLESGNIVVRTIIERGHCDACSRRRDRRREPTTFIISSPDPAFKEKGTK